MVATRATFSSVWECLGYWLLVRMLPGLFGAGLRLVHNFSMCSHTCHRSVCMAVRYAWAFAAMGPR